VVEQGTHKPLVGSPNLPLGTKKDFKVLAVCGGLNPNETTFCYIWGSQKQEISMSTLKTQDQGIIILSMRMVRNGLSIEASMGLQSEGSISIEKMGAI
jgi:hypothetical protein